MLSIAELIEVVLSLLAILGSSVGNCLLFYVLYITKSLRRSASANLILNSAIINLLNVLINISFALDYLIFQTGNLDNSVAPPIVNSMITFFLLLTSHSTLMMMGDKVLILKYPVFYHNRCTVKKARFVCLLLWLSATAYTPALYVLRSLRSSNSSSTVIEYMTVQHRGNGKYFIFGIIFAALLFLLLVCRIACRALKALSNQMIEPVNTRQENTGAEERATDLRRTAQIKKDSYACRTVLMVLVVYVISFCPILFNSLLRILDVTPLEYNREQIFIPIFCSQLGAILNPYIFILRSKSYRRAALLLLKRLACCEIRAIKI